MFPQETRLPAPAGYRGSFLFHERGHHKGEHRMYQVPPKTLLAGLLPGLFVLILVVACGGDADNALEPAAGSCFASSTADYSEKGPYRYQVERVGGFNVYVPRATPGGCDRFPLVGYAMGTIMSTDTYEDYYETFASWGMMTVVDPANLLNLGGSSLEDAMDTVRRDSAYAGRITRLGAIGHSQGGAAVVNVALDDKIEVDAIVGLMPALFQGGGSIDAAGLYIGAGSDLFGVTTDPALAYSKTDGPAFIADLRGEGHIGGVNGGPALAMSTAWLRCHLTDDNNACDLFATSRNGGSCAFPGSWSKCEGKNY